MFPLWLVIVIIFYFLSGYWLWKLINIFYYCDFVAIIHWIGEGNGNPLQYSCLENPVDRGAWGLLSIGSHRVGHNWSNLACMHALEKEMATHSSTFAWRIPRMEEPGVLLSVGSHRVGHSWSDLAAATGILSPLLALFVVMIPKAH